MYIVIKKFKSSDIEKSFVIVKSEFLPLVVKLPGFVDYHVIRAGGDVLCSVLLFNSEAEATASTDLSKNFVRDHSYDSFFQLQDLTGGEVVVKG